MTIPKTLRTCLTASKKHSSTFCRNLALVYYGTKLIPNKICTLLHSPQHRDIAMILLNVVHRIGLWRGTLRDHSCYPRVRAADLLCLWHGRFVLEVLSPHWRIHGQTERRWQGSLGRSVYIGPVVMNKILVLFVWYATKFLGGGGSVSKGQEKEGGAPAVSSISSMHTSVSISTCFLE